MHSSHIHTAILLRTIKSDGARPCARTSRTEIAHPTGYSSQSRPKIDSSSSPFIRRKIIYAIEISVQTYRIRYQLELPITGGTGKALRNIRDAGQEDRLLPVPRIPAEDELVPVNRVRNWKPSVVWDMSSGER